MMNFHFICIKLRSHVEAFKADLKNMYFKSTFTSLLPSHAPLFYIYQSENHNNKAMKMAVIIQLVLVCAFALLMQHNNIMPGIACSTPRLLYHWQHGEPSRNPGSNSTTHKHPPNAAQSPSSRPGTLSPSQCTPACSNRCSATQHLNACMYFCEYCCARCLCVPPGTYGNKETCPCYNNMKTKEGGPKCP